MLGGYCDLRGRPICQEGAFVVSGKALRRAPGLKNRANQLSHFFEQVVRNVSARIFRTLLLFEISRLNIVVALPDLLDGTLAVAVNAGLFEGARDDATRRRFR